MLPHYGTKTVRMNIIHQLWNTIAKYNIQAFFMRTLMANNVSNKIRNLITKIETSSRTLRKSGEIEIAIKNGYTVLAIMQHQLMSTNQERLLPIKQRPLNQVSGS